MKAKFFLTAFVTLFLAIAITRGSVTAFTDTICDSTYVKQQDNVFTVYRTGVNDTNNLQCAFDSAVDYGSGSSVQLLKGIYYIDRDISVVNFDGSFIGAGKEKTFVQNLDEVPFPHHVGPYFFNIGPGLFVFFQDENGGPSSILISDLTFRTIGSAETSYMHGGLEYTNMNALEIYGKVTNIEDDEISYFNTSILRVGFEGQGGDEFWMGYNLLNPVAISGEGFYRPCGDSNCVDYVKPISGNHIFQDCTINNAVFGYTPILIQDSNVVVVNSKFSNSRLPIQIFDMSNSIVDIQHNSMINAQWYGVDIVSAYQATIGWDLGPHGDLPEPSIVNISHNFVSVSDTGDGIMVEDYGFLMGEKTIEKAIINRNEIRLEGTIWGGIGGIGASGVTVTNNRIYGDGALGIYAGLWDDPVSDWVILGNNLQNANTEFSRILLGPSTSNFIVVGGSNSANVFDLGYENIITGINVSYDTNLGQLVKEALLDRRDIKLLLR